MFNATLPGRRPSRRHLSYPERLAILDLEPLEVRRRRVDLLMFYKIFNGFVVISKTDHFKYSNPASIFTRFGGPKLVKPICHSNKIANNFFFDHINFWRTVSLQYYTRFFYN